MITNNLGLHTCCFFGHRKIYETEILKKELHNTVEDLIARKNINTFLFGSNSEFNSLCLDIVTELKKILNYCRYYDIIMTKEMVFMKRLYKSTTDKKIFGVCGGIAEYFDIDPTLIRLLWAISILCLGTGLLAYIIAAIILPESPQQN